MDLPCPFCQTPDAGVALIRQSAVHEYVFCDACSAKGPVGYNGDGEALWNTRPREDALQAEVERLREADDLLAWLDKHPHLELSWGPVDDPSECFWIVHATNGSVNDREWRRVGHGNTPKEALANARAALKGAPHE